MTIKAPIISDLLQIPYPDEGTDPFYGQFQDMFKSQELVAFYSKMFGNMFLGAGGVRSWNSSTGVLAWTADFVVGVPHYGFKITVSYGPDGSSRLANLQDGQILFLNVPAVVTSNLTLKFGVASQLDPSRHDQFVCGQRLGSALYLRNIGEMT